MRNIVVLSAISLITGCTVFTDQYTCGDIPEAGCTPVSEVYDKTSGKVYDYRKDFNKLKRDDDEKTKAKLIKVSSAHRTINYINPSDSILTKPVVMRVLYCSFENDQQDLDAGGYTYLRMRKSEWVIQK